MMAYHRQELLFLASIFALLLLACSGKFIIEPVSGLNETTALVTRVSDVNTISIARPIRCEVGSKMKDITRVRYIGVDALEHDELLYKSARALNESLVYGKRVKLVFDEARLDQYDRLLAYVYVDDLLVNAELIKRGYARARAVRPNVRHQEEFEALEAEARAARRGMWRLIEETPGNTQPSPTQKEAMYVASELSDVFHRPSCRWAKEMAEENRVYFRTYQEAIASGRRPCKVCKPGEEAAE